MDLYEDVTKRTKSGWVEPLYIDISRVGNGKLLLLLMFGQNLHTSVLACVRVPL